MTASSRIPTNAEIRAESDLVRRALLGAIQRIALGHPIHVRVGATTLSALALEAQVPRHHLYERHRDLRERHAFLAAHTGEPTAEETQLRGELDQARAQLVTLQGRHRRISDELHNWKATAELLQRAINVLQEELRQEQLTSQRIHQRLSALTAPDLTIAPVVALRPRLELHIPPRPDDDTPP